MVINLTTQEFKEKIFNYEVEKDWKFLGEKPAIVDFYADWCGPCKSTGPILEELSEEYKDIDIYKINVDEENEVAGAFGIKSIPSFLFIPTGEDQPQMMVGGLPKDHFENGIKDVLKTEKS